MKRLRCGTPGRQGIFRFMIKLTGNETVTARAGLPLVLEVGRALRLDEEVARRVQLGSRQRGFSVNDKLEALVLLVAAGGDRVEDIQVLAEDRGLMRLLDRTLPSPDSLLRFLHEVGGGPEHAAAQEQARTHGASRGELCHVPAESDAMRGLEAVNHVLIARSTAAASPRVATVDHDATIIESHKRTARIAYEGTRGYQPMLAVWAEQGLVLVDEFRDGNVPAGKDPLHSIERAFGALPVTVTERYFRGDSANYHADVLKYLVKQDIGFTISADMTPQLRAVCCAVDERDWSLLESRTTEDVHIADVEFAPGVWSKDAAPLRYVALRMTPRQSELAPTQTKPPAVRSSSPSSAIAAPSAPTRSCIGTGRRLAPSSTSIASSKTNSAPASCPVTSSPPTPRGCASTSSPPISSPRSSASRSPPLSTPQDPSAFASSSSPSPHASLSTNDNSSSTSPPPNPASTPSLTPAPRSWPSSFTLSAEIGQGARLFRRWRPGVSLKRSSLARTSPGSAVVVMVVDE